MLFASKMRSYRARFRGISSPIGVETNSYEDYTRCVRIYKE